MSGPGDSGLVFVSELGERPALEIRVNFGIFAGRTVTPAEIDRLAEWLLDIVDGVTIVSEERHEIGTVSEGMVHQVRIDLTPERVPDDPGERQELAQRLVERADHWARQCMADRPSLSTGL
jgi:hypothetical protein